ncbi:uncharacterized protein LOC144927767 isoform X2 [Branchiostoma floridae x Branchiostoma belcheri]
MNHRKKVACFTLALLLLVKTAKAVTPEQITCSTISTQITGQTNTVVCPGGCLTAGGSVWGTGNYTSDSRVCKAAIHAGMIPTTGGMFTVNKLSGQPSYQASTQNGVTTRAYGSYGSSFSVSRAQITCNTISTQITGETFTVVCPGGCLTAGGSVWGTGIYTSDSRVCKAAIHDGRISTTGGVVTGYKLPGQPSYQASTQNGVTTRAYGSYSSSFGFSQVNECATNNGGCAGNCTDTVGSFICSCGAGYVLNADGLACDNVDECATNNGGCAGNCTDTVGSFTCSCGAGYELNADGLACDNVDECATNNGGCAGNCTDTVGSFNCSCGAGYVLNADGLACDSVTTQITCTTDSTEITGQTFTVVCPGGCLTGGSVWGTGIYTSDSRVCKAAIHDGRIPTTGGVVTGYKLPGQPSYQASTQNGVTTRAYGSYSSSFGFSQVNECATNNGGCAGNCTDTVGSFICSCGAGYVLNADGLACDNVDECATNNGGCAGNCTDTVGSFNCSCGAGYVLNADGLACDNVDECATNNGGCAGNCTDTAGSFNCSCGAGYVLNADGLACDSVITQITCTTDSTEITGQTFTVVCPGGCLTGGSVWGTGIYTSDSRVCKAAIHDGRIPTTGGVVTGYKLPGQPSYQASTQNGVTTRAYGSYSSSFGFSQVNECATNNGGCAGNCTDTVGSFICSCGAGYVLNADGLACDNVDECATNNGGCAGNCTDTVGSFNCSCGAGYVLNVDGLACDNVDECATNNGGCAGNCTDTVGSFNCSCGAGYVLNADGLACDSPVGAGSTTIKPVGAGSTMKPSAVILMTLVMTMWGLLRE